jgi:hypothetical protein
VSPAGIEPTCKRGLQCGFAKKLGRSNKRAARNGYRHASVGESEGTLMAKRVARRQTKRQRAESGKRLTPLIALKERAMRNIEDLATQIHHCCSDKKRTSREKRVACSQLVKLALLSTAKLVLEIPPLNEKCLSDWPFSRARSQRTWMTCGLSKSSCKMNSTWGRRTP